MCVGYQLRPEWLRGPQGFPRKRWNREDIPPRRKRRQTPAHRRHRFYAPRACRNVCSNDTLFVFLSCLPDVSAIYSFLEACERLVANNLEFIPPYAPNARSGSFYIRPLLFGSGPSLNPNPAKEFTFLVYGSPVGSLYSTFPFPFPRPSLKI
jgi:hypothetical protein